MEQQLVQSAHAAFTVGNNNVDEVDHRNTPFVVIGVKDEQALKAVAKILDVFHFDHDITREEDMDDQITAIATFPIEEEARFPLLAFKTLRFSK